MKLPDKDSHIIEFDCGMCVPPDGNRPAQRPGRQKLLDGIARYGQSVPALLCPHPDMLERFLILDGVGRWDCCRELGIKLKGVLVPEAVPEAEQIKLRFQHNVIRRNLTPDEIADDADRFMTLTGATQEQAAKELGISAASLSKAFAMQRRIPESLHPLASLVRPSIRASVGTLKKHADMEKTLVYATTQGGDGKLPTRDQVARFMSQFREPKTHGPKPTLIKGEVEGRTIAFSVEPDETGETLIEFFQAMKSRLGRFKTSPAANLGFLFAE